MSTHTAHSPEIDWRFFDSSCMLTKQDTLDELVKWEDRLDAARELPVCNNALEDRCMRNLMRLDAELASFA